MLVANIQWTPVQVQSYRVSNNRYEISRDGQIRGVVEFRQGRWYSNAAPPGSRNSRAHPSWRAAVLHLARFAVWWGDDSPQDYGFVRMIRVNCGGAWYTVLADGDRRHLYSDSAVGMQPEPRDQCRVWRALRVAEKALRGKPDGLGPRPLIPEG